MSREFANQREYFDGKPQALGLADDDYVETPDGEFQLSVVDFRRWVAEYAVLIGIGISKSPQPHTGRVLVLLPEGGGRLWDGWSQKPSVL